MAYASTDFKTKKAFREAVAQGAQVTLYSPGPFGCRSEGTEFVEGPHYPKPHTWYAQVTLINGIVTKVK